MSALQGMDMLMYSYAEKCIPLNAPLAWFEYGLELSYCVLSTSILLSLQKIDSSFCYDVQFGTCLIMSSLNVISFIVSGTSMNYLLLYHQWYGGISLSYLQWNVGMCYRQWYGGISLSSSVVRR